MSHEDVRKGITQYKMNEQVFAVLALEIIFLSVVVGVLTQSWYAGGISFIVLIILCLNKYFVMLFSLLASVFWGFNLGGLVSSLFDGDGARVVISVIIFIMSLGIHFSAFQYANDI